jgi:hypothetical protein
MSARRVLQRLDRPPTKLATAAKQIAAELVAEAFVVYFKVFATVFIFANFNGLWAAAMLGAFQYISTVVFGLHVNTFTDPWISLLLLIKRVVDHWGTKTAVRMRSVIVTIIEIIFDVGFALLAGLSVSAVFGGALLSDAFAIDNMQPNTGWATAIFASLMMMIAYHIIAFSVYYSPDGFASSLAVGFTYFAVSIVTFTFFNGFLDVTANIGTAIILGANDNVAWFWWVLLMQLAAVALTFVFYYLLWNMFFSDAALREKRDLGTAAELTLLDVEHQHAEEAPQKGAVLAPTQVAVVVAEEGEPAAPPPPASSAYMRVASTFDGFK